MASVALVTEGDFDIEALSPLIRRLNSVDVKVYARPCGKSVGGRFIRRLNELRHLHPTIDKAIVVSDANGRNPTVWAQQLQQQAGHLVFPFTVEYVILVQELEAVLLCDPRAIESVCADRGRAIALPNLTASPELLADPKSELVRQLKRGGVPYTKVVAGEIANRANLDSLDYWSPSFRRFRAVATLRR